MNPPAVVTIDARAANARQPIAALPVVGTLAFVPGGNLLVLERQWDKGCVVAHEYAPSANGWAEIRTVAFKGFKGSPVGCAVSADGTRLAIGLKTAKVFAWPTGKGIASMPAVKYQLEWSSLGFSPSGALLAVADGGYVSPRQRAVKVCDAATGDKRVAIKTDEWNFVRAGMLDESTVVTLGLALDWEFGNQATTGERVLGCYDVATRTARWRRTLRAYQFAGLDRAAGLVWVADDTEERVTANLVGLAAADGRVARELAFDSGRRAGGCGPVAVGPSLLAFGVQGAASGAAALVVIDVDTAQQVATLGHRGSVEIGERPPAADPGTRRVAAVGEGKTFIWELP